MSFQLWFTLLGLFFLGGSLFRLPLLAASAAAGMGMLLLAHLWRRQALKNIIYRRRWRFRRGFPGETADVRIEIHNKKLLPLSWLRTSDRWPAAVGPEDPAALAPSHILEEGTLVQQLSLTSYEQVTRRHKLLFRKRGVYRLGPLRMESGDLFGLTHTSRTLDAHENLTVFPEMLPLEALKLPTDDPFGDRRAERRLFEDPNLPFGVRPYHPEDDMRRVHWNATARSGSLQVKVHQPVSARALVVCLNVSTSAQPHRSFDPDLLEYLVSASATLVYHANHMNYAVGLLSNGRLAYADQPFQIPVSRSPPQLAHLLEALAAVTPYTQTRFETYLYQTMPRLPYGATLLVVSGVHSPELEITLVRLKRYRANTTLISLAVQAPSNLPGIRCIHLPFRERQS
jgi:uncharacterized protein (DUF58 family)